MSGRALQADDLPETRLVDEAFLFALPQVLLVLLGERAEADEKRLQVEGVHVVRRLQHWSLVAGLDQLAVGQQTGVHRGPIGVQDFLLLDARTLVTSGYSITQSSYESICSMQGLVSFTGGTEIGTLPNITYDIGLNYIN